MTQAAQPAFSRAAPPLDHMRFSQYATLKERYYHDPVGFCRDVLGEHLWSKQRAVLESVADYPKTVVRSGNSVGKTFVSACAALWFLYCRTPCKVVTTATSHTQVVRVLWGEIRRLGLKAPPGPRYLKQSVNVDSDWFAIGISPREEVSFKGYHQKHVLVIFDEAPGVRREIYTAALTCTATPNSRMLMIGNPEEPEGHFYDAFRNPLWAKHHINSLQTPRFTGEECSPDLLSGLATRQFIKEVEADFGKESPQYMSMVEGEFPDSSPNMLIPLSWVEKARAEPPNNATRPRYMGVDVAHYGDDSTVIAGLFSNHMRILDHKVKQGEVETTGKIRRFIDDQDIQDGLCIDASGGYGGTTCELLRQDGIPARDVHFGSTTTVRNPRKFANKRTELWFNLRDWIRDGGSIKGCPPQVDRDLTAPKFTYTTKGQWKLESKEDTKKRLGRSPDFGDAMALAVEASHTTALAERIEEMKQHSTAPRTARSRLDV